MSKTSFIHTAWVSVPVRSGLFSIPAGFVLVLFLLSLWSCQSSTAVKGIPVGEISRARKGVAAGPTTKEEEAEIAEMSRVSTNSVFKEMDGIPQYIVGPLDVLEITSHSGDKASTIEVTVDNQGKISYSFIDDITVGGLTPSQIDRTLTEKLANYVRNPRIDVLVKKFNSKSALVLGEFAGLRTTYAAKRESGRVYLQGKTSLMDLIAQAGGYTEDADIRKTRIIRAGRTYNINLYDIIEKGDQTLNVIIDDGDIVEISKLPEFGERVYVMGEVAHQGVYALRDAQDLLGAIALAGSYTRLAREEYTLVVREYRKEKKPQILMANVKDILTKGDLSQNIRLLNGDLVYVPRMRIGDINDWIANITPLLDLLFYPAREYDYYLRWKEY